VFLALFTDGLSTRAGETMSGFAIICRTLAFAGGICLTLAGANADPDPTFKGKIETYAKNSTPSWPAAVVVPANAPNVVLVLLDDVGFGAASTFGGPVQTRAFEKQAAIGLRYNEFHTTAVCAPTRAALLSGRNHHRIGFGVAERDRVSRL